MPFLKYLVMLGFYACLPLKHIVLTSPYGFRIHPVTGKYSYHAGIDLRARHDTVYAVMPGTVARTAYDPFLGLYIKLEHGDLATTYGHLSQIFVFQRDSVNAGDAIGRSGLSGRTTGEHLHFAVQYRGRYINPLKFLYLIINQSCQQTLNPCMSRSQRSSLQN
jgi:murein DD-endopeptidase MepM/ murein hydrolase activator NlpD